MVDCLSVLMPGRIYSGFWELDSKINLNPEDD